MTDINRISIHSPRTGRDKSEACEMLAISIFQSTRPARGETDHRALGGVHRQISIHSPRTGRDSAERRPRSSPHNFNPLAPHGARLLLSRSHVMMLKFQSTRPARGETTGAAARSVSGNTFQSTRPARGETHKPPECHWWFSDFNPLAPHGARPL